MRGNSSMRQRGVLRVAVSVVCVLALFATACGGGEVVADDPADTAAPTSAPATEVPDTQAAEPDPVDDSEEAEPVADDAESDAAMSEDETEPEPAPSDEPDCSQATASDVGVTADTITVGLISVDLTPLFGTGFVNENTPGEFFSRNFSLIHAINEAGGINCRQIEMVQETYDPARSAETQVPACERLAQDREVFVSLAAFPDAAGGGVDCMWDRFGMQGCRPATIRGGHGRHRSSDLHRSWPDGW